MRTAAIGSPIRLRVKHFGIGVGSLVLTVNVSLLSGYTLGCHSLRHLVGGYLDRLSGRPIRQKTYDCVSCLNRGHMNWAWASLFWVAFSRHLCPHVRDGDLARRADSLSA